jgi:hypothetical protein
MPRWGLLTNHALVLIHVIEHPKSTLRNIADEVGITDRAALSILRMLEEDDIVARRKEGRSNVYTVDIAALMAFPGGNYSISQLANALLALAGRVPGFDLPPGMQITGGAATETVAETQQAAAAPTP